MVQSGVATKTDAIAATSAPDTEAKPDNLKPVLDVIPDECYENPTWRGLAYFSRDLLIYAAATAGLVPTDKWYLVVALWVVAGLAIFGLFSIAHDSAHWALFRSRRLCGVVGRIAFLPLLHPYEGWRFGHNRLHHGHTNKVELDPAWTPLTPEQYRALSPYRRSIHRLSWSAWGAGFYYLKEITFPQLVTSPVPRKWRAAVRRDRILVGVFLCLVTAGLFAVGWSTYSSPIGGVWLWVKVFALPVLIAHHLLAVSVYLHHTAPDLARWRRSEWNSFTAQVEGTSVIWMPRGFDLFFHRLMVHTPHHVDMRIPMYNLPAAAEAIIEAFPEHASEERFSALDYLRRTRRCKLYDLDHHQWLTYREAASRAAVDEACADA